MSNAHHASLRWGAGDSSQQSGRPAVIPFCFNLEYRCARRHFLVEYMKHDMDNIFENVCRPTPAASAPGYHHRLRIASTGT
jgi:hypothetical protein